MTTFKLWVGNLISIFIIALTKTFKIEIYTLAQRYNGIGKSHSFEASGEKWLIENKLSELIGNNPRVIIDVGANTGKYSQLLAQNFPKTSIYSFEPSPETFKICLPNLKKYENVSVINKGLGIAESKLKLYTLKDNLQSVNASSDINALLAVSTKESIVSYEIEITSLEVFAKSLTISEIDFLKIDTEGFELDVLKGCGCLLIKKKIKVIQFEFNEVSAVRRLFLKDFYGLLYPHYSFFRLDSKKLLPLGEYSPINEIFQFQNIIAVLNK